jgi:16S rRNA (cytidine1402-2'-O)-methyltransferase
MLYIVSTPIGNMRDISYRAIDILGSCNLILAEDTRRTMTLLRHYNINNKMESFNDINYRKKVGNILTLLKEGKDIALVTDSGTPGISDPGFLLVRECMNQNIVVTSVPGASAFLCALTSSGLPTDSFTFIGFLPKKEKKIAEIFMKERKETLITYESPHRIIKTLNYIKKFAPERKLVLARELTKKFEELIRGTAEDILNGIGKRKIKGEIVLLIGK